MEVRDPADHRSVVGEVPAMGAHDVAEVYDAAVDGAARWAATSPIARGRTLLRAAQLLRERAEPIAAELTREMGKTLAEARGEVGKSADFFEYCGGLARASQGEQLADERPGVRAWTIREPLGVVLAICPWNDPLLTPARKVAPALIAGNAVILKPASYTPLVSLHLARALADAGLPSGVLSTVTGRAAAVSGPLLEHEALRAVSFTGSNEVGAQISHALAGRRAKILSELGGKNAAIVLEDAELERAADTIATAAFAQAGQRCTAISRVVVERAVADSLIALLTERAGALVLGPGLAPDTTMGPLVSPEQQRSVSSFIERAISGGVDAVAGGRTPQSDHLAHGCFVEPTVLREVTAEMEVWREEIFGPVLAVLAVADLDEAINVVNDSPYGLSASIFTTRLNAAMRFADEAEVGQVAINLPTSGWDVHMPFGGYKQSGSGLKEQGTDGVAFYTRTKTVALAT